ncbi:MAG: biotin/lipoyl-binding protein [Chloroflexi bacterium]|nr:biotin/lipoyl-binding protein [Chloroflexota bacterium]
MRYWATVGGHEYSIEIDSENKIVIDGTPHHADLQSIDGATLYSLLVDHESYDLVVDREGDTFRILLRGEMYTVSVEDERTRRLKESGPLQAPSGEVVVKAPMPGLVVAVPAQEGSSVEMGQGLVILEAMKMENEIRTPRGGTVKSVKVTPGQVVDQGQALVIIG